MASEELFTPGTSEYSEEIACGQPNPPPDKEEQILEIADSTKNAKAAETPAKSSTQNASGATEQQQSSSDTIGTIDKEDESESNAANKDKPTEKLPEARLTQLPLARIKHLMKLDPDLQIASVESVFLITKATELFIESLARESFVHTAQAKKKTMQKKDVDLAISTVDSLMFLEGAMNF